MDILKSHSKDLGGGLIVSRLLPGFPHQIVDGTALPERSLAFASADGRIEIQAKTQSRVMLLGGEKMDGPRFIWWNFVASSKQRIEAAKQRWREQRFAAIPGEQEFIPLPEH